jgi:hypothetical protein
MWRDAWKPEKWSQRRRLLLGNYFVNTFPLQRKSKQQSFGGNDVFCRSAPRLYNEEPRPVGIKPRVEAGSNTSTVILRVVGGDEKGSLESETVKYDRESHGTLSREWLRWRGPVATANDTPLLSSERASQLNKPATVRH